MLSVCIDTNIWISGIISTGSPSKVVNLALRKKIQVVASLHIIDELKRNLVNKFNYNELAVSIIRNQIEEVADIYQPEGAINVVPNRHADNLILETAWLGKADYLVTGDRKHLLPLKTFKGIQIVDAGSFLKLMK